MGHFEDSAVNLDILKKRAFNYRWAEVQEGVIPLTAADPDFPVAPQIIKAMKDYLDGGYLSYTPKLGLPEFREEIAKSLNTRKNEHVNPEWVLPIDSAARGMYIAAQAVLEPGDEMLIFDPVDYLFGQAALAAGAETVLFPAVIKDNKIDLSTLEDYITPKTKMIGLCNPHNPWGTVYTEEDLDHILKIAEKHNIWIMNDEIWSDIVYSEKPFKSILSLSPERNKKIISVFGFSKSFGVAGLRIGCIYCHDQQVFDKIVEVSHVMTTAGGIASISQIAGIACLREGYPYVEEFIAHLTKNRDYAYERLNNMKGISCTKPQATYLIFPDITKTGLKSQEFADFMTENAGLAVVPGTAKFFGPGAEGHIRICFATSRKILEEGLNRLEKGLSLINKI
ncbi:pyridoxal phosphate-dependent aminotransferase [Anaeropeptidivorans aminofermentans]|uniref:pyridoxal phosphate-dependent aminotransferase n=1 Tax=Anaeropeptidivorans aminofermentans TaxID=2934315 RepID=UPI0020249C8D|nr:pyridoxal phosphate-dependent aminotransferase [Anaeropeptidivorans aminofermentans]